MNDGSKVLQQDETLVFRASKDLRIIDRIITLTAQDKDAVFKDSKEGAIAIRLTRSLEEPSTKAEIFTDASGKPTKVAKLDNTGVNGVYLSSLKQTESLVLLTGLAQTNERVSEFLRNTQ
ncbi:MAG: hypothetical protein EBR83_02975, partial [Verrucomicrobia bacterium]|nr:hypothetical protein [Verrucomicrobiota bacterium]